MTEPESASENLPASAAWVSVGRWTSMRQAEQRELVLQALDIHCAIVGVDADGSAYDLIVRAEEADRARDEIDAFVRENRSWPPRAPVQTPVSEGLGGALIFAWLLTIAFIAQTGHSWGIDWLSAGSADASVIRHGAVWRAITSLTLHSDVVHLGSNVLFGALFGAMLSHSVGVGAAWLIFVAAGALGNICNAWWQPPGHVSIGASTGVFGSLGAQSAFDWMRRGRVRLHPLRRWAPIIVGIAVLAWLGGSGERRVELRNGVPDLRDIDLHIDVAAHVFGFLAGIVLGALSGRRTVDALRNTRVQQGLAILAVMLVALAWLLTLR